MYAFRGDLSDVSAVINLTRCNTRCHYYRNTDGELASDLVGKIEDASQIPEQLQKQMLRALKTPARTTSVRGSEKKLPTSNQSTAVGGATRGMLSPVFLLSKSNQICLRILWSL